MAPKKLINAMATKQRHLRFGIISLLSLALLALGFLQAGMTSPPGVKSALVVKTESVPLITTTSSTTPPTTAPRKLVSSVPAPPKNSYAPEPIVRIGEMEIPKIGLVTPIYHGITLRNIDNGPSHWPGTAMPGEIGNSVFAGHRVTHSHPFRNIDQLVPGDLVIFNVNGVKSTYSVTGHEIVKPDALWIANPTPDATATIFACHPPHYATYRYVVRMKLVQ